MIDLGAVAKQLIADEGFRAVVYDDATGHPLGILPSGGRATVGYGFELSVDGLTVAESLLILHSRIQARSKELEMRFPWFKELDSVRQGVLTQMAFNMGLPRLLKFVKMFAALQAKNYELAAAEILDSDAARQLPSRYLRLSNSMRMGAHA